MIDEPLPGGGIKIKWVWLLWNDGTGVGV
jgi:hypothetical protein